MGIEKILIQKEGHFIKDRLRCCMGLRYTATRRRNIFVGNYGSYGKSVFIDHGNGIQTRYAHLSKIFVKKEK